MSGKKKPASNRAKGQPPKRRQRSQPVQNAYESSDYDTKDLSPATVTLILCAVLVIGGGVIWYALSADRDPVKPLPEVVQNTDPEQDKKSKKDATETTKPVVEDKKLWTTEEDQQARWNQIDDATADGWDTEAISDRVMAQWVKLKKLLASEEPINAEALQPLASADVVVHSVLPAEPDTVFENSQLTVRRLPGDGAEPPVSPPVGTGMSALADSLKTLIEPYVDRNNLRLKWKVFRVNPGEKTVTTQQTLEIFGETAEGFREENATWQCEWTVEKKPHLKSVRLVDYESVDAKDQLLFADCTTSLFGDADSYQNQLLRGFNYWLGRRQTHGAFFLMANNGVAVGDVNGDGLEDVYFCQESELPNLLFLQNPDGTLRDASAESGVDWLQNSSTALIVDLNNDGHQDLAVGVTGTVVIAAGDGSGKFEIREILDATDEAWSLAAADYDRDGLLDLHVGSYTPTGIDSVAANVVLTMSDFADGGVNSLFHNESSGDKFAFRNVTDDVGMDVNNQRKTYSAGWEDMDNDGDLDLYVANDFGWNCFFRNDQTEDGETTFVDIASQAGGLDDSFGMSVNFGDYDRDGWIDLYISNMYSYAGNRITFQDQFKADSTDSVRQRFQRFARGNTLLRNTGVVDKGTAGPVVQFEDRSVETAVNMGRWAWSSCFLDINNDGWEDLYVNNGYITASDSGDL
ncbi:MAG: VCBS repeat-containing protein [Pirellulaceae bacterium]|nr:VCBS repeat-containing protein [Pirellulaceae bacterium]MDG2105119.1 VCBS repeat-containing protein [Pirellulaceae bacterium]